MIGLTNNLVVFGGSKDVRFNQELSDLMGDVRVARHSWQSGTMAGRSTQGDDIAVMTGSEIRELDEGTVLILAENAKPIIAKVNRCIAGRSGAHLLADPGHVRQPGYAGRDGVHDPQGGAGIMFCEERGESLTIRRRPYGKPNSHERLARRASTSARNAADHSSSVTYSPVRSYSASRALASVQS